MTACTSHVLSYRKQYKSCSESVFYRSTKSLLPQAHLLVELTPLEIFFHPPYSSTNSNSSAYHRATKFSNQGMLENRLFLCPLKSASETTTMLLSHRP